MKPITPTKILSITDEYILSNFTVDYPFFSDNPSDTLETYVCDIDIDFDVI